MLQKFKTLLFASCLCAMPTKAEDRIKFDVELPLKVSMKKQLTYAVVFKNNSKSSVLVPNFLLGGMGIFYYYDLFDESGNNIIPGVVIEYIFGTKALNNKLTPLQPAKIRKAVDWIPTKEFFRGKPGRYRMVFHWDGYLDDDNTTGTKTHFSCEKWITVTK